MSDKCGGENLSNGEKAEALLHCMPQGEKFYIGVNQIDTWSKYYKISVKIHFNTGCTELILNYIC